jgi:hypothetical protein
LYKRSGVEGLKEFYQYYFNVSKKRHIREHGHPGALLLIPIGAGFYPKFEFGFF